MPFTPRAAPRLGLLLLGGALVASAIAACRARAPAARLVEPGPAAARTVGRFDGPRFSWSGSTIEARFIGTSIVLLLRVAPLEPHVVKVDGKEVTLHETKTTYSVVVDGGAAVTVAVSPDRERYELASGLDASQVHQIAITRDAEAFAGVHELLGLEVPGGRLVAPERRARVSLEFVGDSIACGYGVLGADASCPFTYETERASLAYPALVGRALDADVTTLCWSGRGVLRNYDGSTTDTMPVLYERTIPTIPETLWSFRAPAPAAVVVALGTNDLLGGRGAPLDLPAFEAAYVRFLRRVREVRPEAWIVVATSPMLGDESTPSGPGAVRVLARASLERVVARRTADGDARVTLLELEHQGSRVGCDAHPNAAMHRALARQVEVALRAKIRP